VPCETIKVRLLSPSDADLLATAGDDVFDFPVRRDYAESFLGEPNSLIVVALDGDRIVGMASAFTYRHPDKPLQMFVNEVGVAEHCRRRGIGQALMVRILAAARERGAAEVWVATEEDNAPARAFYAALGGKEDEARAIVYVYKTGDEPGS
jgi:ribosomal protein S18 acetylase RimI-like enzyme